MFWMVGYNGNSIQCPYMVSFFNKRKVNCVLFKNKLIDIHHRCGSLLANWRDLQVPPCAWDTVPQSADFLTVQFEQCLITAVFG
jgi:hypothetical protein